MIGEVASLWDAELARAASLARQRVEAFRPGGWDRDWRQQEGERWVHSSDAIMLWSIQREKDGRAWIHVSLSTPTKIPGWEFLKAVKTWVIGEQRYAYQVLPPAERYVNKHPYVLHLWAVIDGDEPLPDFIRAGGEI